MITQRLHEGLGLEFRHFSGMVIEGFRAGVAPYLFGPVIAMIILPFYYSVQCIDLLSRHVLVTFIWKLEPSSEGCLACSLPIKSTKPTKVLSVL